MWPEPPTPSRLLVSGLALAAVTGLVYNSVSDARMLGILLGGIVVISLALYVVGLGLELFDLKEGLGESGLEIGGELVVVQRDRGLGQEGTRALGHRQAELPQEAANRIDAGGPGSQIAGA